MPSKYFDKKNGIFQVPNEILNDYNLSVKFLYSFHFREASLNEALDGVDISVHCDINTFAWLMDYIKYDASQLVQTTQLVL